MLDCLFRGFRISVGVGEWVRSPLTASVPACTSGRSDRNKGVNVSRIRVMWIVATFANSFLASLLLHFIWSPMSSAILEASAMHVVILDQRSWMHWVLLDVPRVKTVQKNHWMFCVQNFLKGFRSGLSVGRYSAYTFSHYKSPFPTRDCIPYVRSGLYEVVTRVEGIRVCALQCVRAVTSIRIAFEVR